MHIKDVELFLSELLRRRSQYHFGLNEPYQKLSKIEVEILCLLLEVNRRVLLLLIFHFILCFCTWKIQFLSKYSWYWVWSSMCYRAVLFMLHQLVDMVLKIIYWRLCKYVATCIVCFTYDFQVFKSLFWFQLPLDDMSLEDPALVQPCITVLRKLNSPLYSGLEIEKQVSCFYNRFNPPIGRFVLTKSLPLIHWLGWKIMENVLAW